MKKVISILIVLTLGMIFIISSCGKTEDLEQIYTNYNVEYLLESHIKDKRFTITYKNPAYANKTTESYENIEDTLWIRFEAKSLDYLYLSGSTFKDTADYQISIFVDSELVMIDSTACNWQCDSTFVEIEYPLP